MRPVTFYFAGSWTTKASDEEVKVGIRNKLCSYVYPGQFSEWSKISQSFEGGKILIDSGAFSVWNKGEVIDLDEYIEYSKDVIKVAQEINKEIRIVNLDVIPGKVGKTSSLNKSSKKEDKAVIDKAAADGFDNLMKMKAAGIKPIHVYHQGESLKWLEKMVQETDYIGVSPANDLTVNQKRQWIDRTYEWLYHNSPETKTHGFAVFAPKIIAAYPWTSVDAATWRLLAAYGQCYFPVGGFSNPDYSKPALHLHISDKSKKYNICFEDDLREMVKADELDFDLLKNSWEERSKMNIRYFLGLEKWVNKRKKVTEYKPRRRFGFAQSI